jgi:tRNA (guanine37-N1)-methyltransferase
MDPTPAVRVLLTPQGERLAQPRVEWLAQQPRLLLLCGHYEGIDERVIEELAPLEISIGDYVLSGGELGAMVLIDAVARLQPGVLGHEASAAEDSFSVRDASGAHLLDWPHYTRPREWRGREVPEVLLSGDHGAVDRWRHAERLARTAARRPDLLRQPSFQSPSNTERPLPAAPTNNAAAHVASSTRAPEADASDLHGPTAPEGA